MLVDEVVSFLHFALGGRCSIDSDPLLDDEVRLSGLVSTNALDLTPLFLVSCSKLTRDHHVVNDLTLAKLWFVKAFIELFTR